MGVLIKVISYWTIFKIDGRIQITKPVIFLVEEMKNNF